MGRRSNRQTKMKRRRQLKRFRLCILIIFFVSTSVFAFKFIDKDKGINEAISMEYILKKEVEDSSNILVPKIEHKDQGDIESIIEYGDNGLIGAHYPVFGKDNIDEINKELVGSYIKEFKDELASNAFRDKDYKYELSVDYETYTGPNDIISINFNITESSSYLAHPDVRISTKVYDLSNDSEIQLDDIMKDDYLKYISQLSESYFNEDETYRESVNNSLFKEGIYPSKENYSNFILKEDRIVKAQNKDTLISLPIDSTEAMVNDLVVELDSPVVIINGRSLVSAKFIEESLDVKVSWDENTKTVSIDKSIKSEEEYINTLTYSNLLDKKSQDEVKKAMKEAEILDSSINSFFQEVNDFNSVVKGISLVEDGFATIDGLEPEYDLYEMQEMWDAKYPLFIGYNCRITSYDLMKDSIHIGKPDIKNAHWMVFDKNALEYNPKDIFTQKEEEDFQTLFSSIPTELTKDVSFHLERVKEDWKGKEIEFPNKDKKSIISVFFHDEENYLFIGHMGVLIPSQDNELLFIEKLSFHAPYQVVKFANRVELNDYLMNKYDISWNQPTAKPFILENDQLLEGYREKPSKLERD